MEISLRVNRNLFDVNYKFLPLWWIYKHQKIICYDNKNSLFINTHGKEHNYSNNSTQTRYYYFFKNLQKINSKTINTWIPIVELIPAYPLFWAGIDVASLLACIATSAPEEWRGIHPTCPHHPSLVPPQLPARTLLAFMRANHLCACVCIFQNYTVTFT